MNIFYLDENPIKCAQYHYDAHVRKMLLESAQLLCTAHRVLDGTEIIKLDKAGRRRKTYVFNDNRDEIFYKSTHVNHPCAIWVRESDSNYMWLFKLYKALCEEFQYRFDKSHKSMELMQLLSNAPKNISCGAFTTPAIVTDGAGLRHGDPVVAYRDYYQDDKLPLIAYTKRDVPHWLTAATKCKCGKILYKIGTHEYGFYYEHCNCKGA